MSDAEGKFSDLATRLTTALVMAVVGLTAVWAGGWWFIGLIVVIVMALVWELARMLGCDPLRSLSLGIGAGALLLLAKLLPLGLGLPLLLLPAIAGVALVPGNRRLFMVYALLIMLAGFGLLIHRETFGLTWMLWLVLLVAATDVMGYFGGRIIGGPKFWPQVSPKKTWSGTIMGWVGAGIVGAIFMQLTGSGIGLIGISVALSMASQMGDIAESAIKRRVGVKDSSNLLPGHGGVLDRFDAMLAAAVLLLFVESVSDFPPLPL